MYYIVDGNVYFYNISTQQAFTAEVKDGVVTVHFDVPMKKHEEISCLYSLNEILDFADGLVAKKPKKKTEK